MSSKVGFSALASAQRPLARDTGTAIPTAVAGNSVHTLQRAVGNRATGRLLGRTDGTATRPLGSSAFTGVVQRTEDDDSWFSGLGSLAESAGSAIASGADAAWDYGSQVVFDAGEAVRPAVEPLLSLTDDLPGGSLLNSVPMLGGVVAPAASRSPSTSSSLDDSSMSISKVGDQSPGLFDAAAQYFRESPALQFGAGVVTGGVAGAAPGGFVVAPVGQATGLDKKFPASFRAGYGLGESAWGVAQIIAGLGGEVGGTLLDLTGIGAAVGIPINVLSAVAIAEGAADVGVGLGVMMSAWDELPEGTHSIVDDPNVDNTRSADPAEALGAALEREGMARPPNHEPHHIVPANDARGARAQEILEEAGIGINDAPNGVWLPRTSANPSTPRGITPEAATSHDSIHTSGYFRDVTGRLERAREVDMVAEELERIRIDLMLGTLPW